MLGGSVLKRQGLELNGQVNGAGELLEVADEMEDLNGNGLGSEENDSSGDSIDRPASVNGHSKSKTVSYRVQNVQHVEQTDVSWDEFDNVQTWMKDLRRVRKEIQTLSPREYAACVQDDFLSPTIVVFTPSNEPVQLPKGATVLDFAYHIYTAFGNRAIGAKVDGCRVGPKYVLRDGQVVEIAMSNGHYEISQEYFDIFRSRMACLQTTRARRKLRIFLRDFSKRLERQKHRSDILVVLGKILGWKQRDEKSELTTPEANFWVQVYCHDVQGLLADVVKVIAVLGLNITKYSGYKQENGEFVMKYYVDDPGGSHAPVLTSGLEEVEGCNRVITGCTLPPLAAEQLGWHFP